MNQQINPLVFYISSLFFIVLKISYIVKFYFLLFLIHYDLKEKLV